MTPLKASLKVYIQNKLILLATLPCMILVVCLACFALQKENETIPHFLLGSIVGGTFIFLGLAEIFRCPFSFMLPGGKKVLPETMAVFALFFNGIPWIILLFFNPSNFEGEKILAGVFLGIALFYLPSYLNRLLFKSNFFYLISAMIIILLASCHQASQEFNHFNYILGAYPVTIIFFSSLLTGYFHFLLYDRRFFAEMVSNKLSKVYSFFLNNEIRDYNKWSILLERKKDRVEMYSTYLGNFSIKSRKKVIKKSYEYYGKFFPRLYLADVPGIGFSFITMTAVIILLPFLNLASGTLPILTDFYVILLSFIIPLIWKPGRGGQILTFSRKEFFQYNLVALIGPIGILCIMIFSIVLMSRIWGPFFFYREWIGFSGDFHLLHFRIALIPMIVAPVFPLIDFYFTKRALPIFLICFIIMLFAFIALFKLLDPSLHNTAILAFCLFVWPLYIYLLWHHSTARDLV